MSIQFKEDINNQKVYIKIDNLKDITARSIRQSFFMLGKDLKKTANKAILKRPKSGRVYIIRTAGGRRRRHRASAPGESHANMTGKLRRALGYKIRGSKTLEFGYGVEAGNPAPDYGKYVEFGTGRMAPRPSLQNAMEETNRNAELYFGQQFERLTQ